MAEFERKQVKVSKQFDADIIDVFSYGEETFGYSTAKTFIGEIYNLAWNLDNMYLMYPECRFLSTRSKMYRNIILGSYLVIYRITPERIEVLRVISSRMSITVQEYCDRAGYFIKENYAYKKLTEQHFT